MKKYILFYIFLLIINTLIAQRQKTFDVTTYGASGNGITDDTKGIQTAIDSAYAWVQKQSSSSVGIIYFPSTANFYNIQHFTPNAGGRYNNYCLHIYSNIWVKGENENNTTIRLADHMFDTVNTDRYANANMFYGTQDSNVTFSNIAIDMNGEKNLVPANLGNLVKNEIAIKINIGNNIKIDSIIIKDNAGRNDICINGYGNGLTVKHCKFLNGGWNIGNAAIINYNQTDFSFLYSESNNSTFEYDTIIQQNPNISLQSASGGIELHGSNSKIENVFMYGCRPSVFVESMRSIPSITDTTSQNILIDSTKMMECNYGVIFAVIHYIDGVIIKNNTIQITYPRANINPFSFIPSGILVTGGNMPYSSQYNIANNNNNSLNKIIIEENTISYDTSNASPHSDSFQTAALRIHSFKNSNISHNVIKYMNFAGIELQGSAWGINNLNITDNIISNFRYNYNPKGVASFLIATDSYSPNSDLNVQYHKQTFKNISITGNTFISNRIDSWESKGSDGIHSTFRGVYFAIPKWYGYNSSSSNVLNPSTFKLAHNNFTNSSEAIGSNPR